MTQDAFIKWVNKRIAPHVIGKGWISPVEHVNIVKRVLNEKFPSGKIIYPDIYSNGGYKGIDNYISRIWSANYSILQRCFSVESTQPERETGVHSSTQSNGFVNKIFRPTSQNTQNYQTSSSNYNRRNTTSSTFNHDKNGVENAYNQLIVSLRDIITDFQKLSFSKNELNEVKRNLVAKLNESLNSVEKEKNFILRYTSWDKLVIGFFGETNAGKSTIIESLRILLRNRNGNGASSQVGKDGEIVGDGRQDFTKDYHEYNLTIGNNQFVLVDVPGIEGNEKIYEDRISEALHKAHMIFYVNGHNKNVDRGTAGKIKKYMSDGVKVTVLYNVRGNAGQYEFPEDRNVFITPNVKTVIAGLNDTFKSILGDKYNNAIPVQGLLAMCSYANFSPKRDDLRRKQNMLVEFFGEDCHNDNSKAREAIKRFSNIDQIINLIKAKSSDFKDQIFRANILKLIGFCNKALIGYKTIIDAELHQFGLYRDQVSRFQIANKTNADNNIDLFKKSLEITLKRKMETFRKDVIADIKRSNYSSVDRKFKDLKYELERVVKEEANRHISEISSNVAQRASRLSGIPGFRAFNTGLIIDPTIDLRFDTRAISDEDSISFGDFFKTAASTGGGAVTGAIIGSLFGPIGTLIGGAIGGFGGAVGGAVDSGTEQTNRAVRKANELVDYNIREINGIINDCVTEYGATLKSQIYGVNSDADRQIGEINRFYSATQSAETKLNNLLKKLQTNG